MLAAADSRSTAAVAAIAKCMAALMLRSSCIPEAEILPIMLKTLTESDGGMPSSVERQCAVLQALGALAEMAGGRHLSMHPARKSSAISCILAANINSALVLSAMTSQAPVPVQRTAMEVVRAWCCMGADVPQYFVSGGGLESLKACLGRLELMQDAADTFAALFQACRRPKDGDHRERAAATPSPSNNLNLLQALVHHLHGMLSLLGDQTAARAGGDPDHEAAQTAAITIMGSAVAAIAAAPDGALAVGPLAEYVGEHLLHLLQSADIDSALSVLAMWDNWFAVSNGHFAPRPEHVYRLIATLLPVVQLPSDLAPQHATADARDLPDEWRMTRREVADSLRLAAAALGSGVADLELLQAGEEALIAWRDAERPSAAWHPLEACLYALNLLRNEPEPGKMTRLLSLSTASLAPQAPKLAGTALTAIGGAAPALGALFQAGTIHPECFEAFKMATAQIVGLHTADDPKLVRNAATTLYRISEQQVLATAICTAMPELLGAELQWYTSQTRGPGARLLEKDGADITAHGWVVKALCCLKVHGPLVDHHLGEAQAALVGGGVSIAAGHVRAIATVLNEVTMLGATPSPPPLSEEQIAALGQLLHVSVAACFAGAGSWDTNLAAATGELSACVAHAAPSLTHHALEVVGQISTRDPSALQAMYKLVGGVDDVNYVPEVVQATVRVVQASFKMPPSDATLSSQIALLMKIFSAWSAPAIAAPGAAEAATEVLQRSIPHDNRHICEMSIGLATVLLQCGPALDPTTASSAVFFLLFSSCGGHPSYATAGTAHAAHRSWKAQGTQRFADAMLVAMRWPMRGGAPWAAWTDDAVRRVLEDLLSAESAADLGRFKRIWKQLCGGKKKGTQGAPPARVKYA